MLYHAFYSNTMVNNMNLLAYEKLKNNPCIKLQIITQIYQLANTDKTVEITYLYNLKDYPNVADCNILFDDSIYCGIVDTMITYGKTV